ncbi:hypothetical protein P4597_00890 [Peribacillus simplex]|uniref:hypothetical protein n=1 Tax=Peribacillus simplex TaxID=1478 RepID=UPI000B278BBF|nr:hypothetical protein [Peribacillus simplex]
MKAIRNQEVSIRPILVTGNGAIPRISFGISNALQIFFNPMTLAIFVAENYLTGCI